MSATKQKPRPVFDWAAARPIVLAEMDRQGVLRSELATATGLPRTTVYLALGEQKQIFTDTLDKLLAGLGRDLAWLIRRMKDDPQPKRT